MSRNPSSSSDVPVYKVGLVMVRNAHGENPEVLMVKPHPDPAKPNYNPDEEVPWVLPRGSRKYPKPGAPKDSAREEDWEDVRNDMDAIKYRNRLEPLHQTLIREAEEETGLSEPALRSTAIYGLGVRPYGREGKITNVQWYVCGPDAITQHEVDVAKPKDIDDKQWISLTDLEKLVDADKARPGYLAVAKEAVAKLKDFSLPLFEIPPAGKSR